MDSTPRADPGSDSAPLGLPAGARASLGLYDLAWGLGLVVASPYLALRAARHREEMRERFGGWAPGGWATPLWIHAASLGEVRGVLPLVRALAARGTAPLVTTVTPAARAAGGEVLAAGAGAVHHAPLDFRPIVRPLTRRLRPRALLICETEIWPGLIVTALEHSVPVAFINARLTARGAQRWGRAASLARALLARVGVAAQTPGDAERWLALGAPAGRVTVTGNTKYALPRGPLGEAQRRALRGGWRSIIVFGSVRSAEAEAIGEALRACRDLPGPLLFVLAPRHRAHAARIVAPAAAVVPRTLVRTAPGPALLPTVEAAAALPVAEPGAHAATLQALLHVDTVGELRQFYSVADAAFIGATLCPIGGHNPFEAAEFGVPVLHGPWTANVTDVVEALAAHGGGWRVADGPQLGTQLVALLSSERDRRSAGAGALRAAQALGGAVERTLAALTAWGIPLDEAGSARPR